MAYAALVSLEQTINLFLKEGVKYSISVAERAQIDSIHEVVIFVISFLENSPEKAIRTEGEIRDVANEAEDLIEFFMCDKIEMSWCRFKQSRGEFQRQLKIVTETMVLVTEDMMDDGPCAAISSPGVAATTAKNDAVIGLDDDVIAIAGRLCGGSSELEVIPIVGMGGIGKTTFARKAYDDPLISERFDIRAWVTVSRDYCVDEILSRLLDSMNLVERKESPTVHKCLKGRRYLVVIDDVWSTEAWDGLMISFPDDNNGSRVMLTTRLPDVAAYSVSEGSPVHEMKLMNEDQSWDLLKRKVFTNGQDCPRELEYIGKAIARACRGLPLAVVLVAGILPVVVEARASWRKIAKNVMSFVDGELEKILSLTYVQLPHHLRACFLYIGGFPEDYEIHASRLIKLWVAEGFLRSERGCKSLEEKAEDCLEDLVKRSLVVVTRRKATGEIKSCSLHDVVRDSCIRIAQEEKFLLHVMDRYNLQQSIKNKRRISSISDSHLKEIQGPSIHTCLCLRLKDGSSLPDFVGSFRLLRVLDVVCIYLGSLPSQLFELIHLRYLALGTPNEIPAAISNLENLQTLIICPRSNYYARTLPLEIWRMQQLRHLEFPRIYGLLNPVDGSTLPLNNLQTLSGATCFLCCRKVLKTIPNLKKLDIYFEKQEDHNVHIYFEKQEDHDVRNLKYLDRLEKLKLISYDDSWKWRTRALPTTLKKLSLVGSCFSFNDMSIVGSLPALQVLKLRGLSYHDGPSQTWETTDGEFPQLRFLLIQDARLEDWITESSHFPGLKCLVLRNCRSLLEIPDGITEIPTLELIELYNVKRSLQDSAKQIQTEQLDCGNTFQLRCSYTYP